MTLAKMLSDRRSALGLSVDAIRLRGSFPSVASVFRWEHGTRPLPHQLPSIARAYSLPVTKVKRAWEAERPVARRRA